MLFDYLIEQNNIEFDPHNANVVKNLIKGKDNSIIDEDCKILNK
jgi:hypothetical protein